MSVTRRRSSAASSEEGRGTPDSLPSMADVMGTKTQRRKERLSAMEVLQAASPRPVPSPKPEDTDNKKLEKSRPNSVDFDFQVASPNLTRLIDNASDTSSPVSFRYDDDKTDNERNLDLDPPPEPNFDENLEGAEDMMEENVQECWSPTEEAIGEAVAEAMEMEAGAEDEIVEGEPAYPLLDTEVAPPTVETEAVPSSEGNDVVPSGEETGVVPSNEDAMVESSNGETLVTPIVGSPAKRGKRGRGKRGRGGGRYVKTAPKPIPTTESSSTSDSLPDLLPMEYDIVPEDNGAPAENLDESRAQIDDEIVKDEEAPLLTMIHRGEELPSQTEPGQEFTPVVENGGEITTPVSRGSARGRGRGRGKRRRMGARSKWTNTKRRSSGPSSTPPRRGSETELHQVAEEEPQYEGVSPTGPELQTPTDTPVKEKRLQDVHKRMEEIQSLVSNIQKESCPKSPRSPRGPNVAKKSGSGCASPRGRRPSPARSEGSKHVSPARSEGDKLHGDLKMTIKLGERRGKKRNRYSEDGDYNPFGHRKRPKYDNKPTRSSSRRNEYDVFLDKYRYLGGDFSDESRSPSPLTVINEPVLSLECKPCQVQLFDFVKCFNIKNLKELNDSAYNKSIRRQIRALEKGHQVARLKGQNGIPMANSPAPAATTTRNDIPLPLLSIQTDQLGHTTSSLKSPFTSHLDDVIDEVIGGAGVGKKKKKKKRKKSTTEKEEGEKSAPGLNTSAETVDTVMSEPSSAVSDGSPKKKFKCRQCTFITADLPCMQEHVNLHEEPFQCSDCSAVFPQISRATEHTIQMHPNSPAKVVRKTDFNPNDHFDEIQEAGGATMQRSSKSTDEKETNYQCQLCTFKTDDRQVIESHLQTKHRAEYQYVCRICDLAFCRKRETMLKHFKKWHPDQPLDFTTAPGAEDKNTEETQTQDAVNALLESENPKRPSRPSSVISIASEEDSVPAGDKDKQPPSVATTSSDDVQIIQVEKVPTPETLGAETRPCTYKCLQCGAKTDTFDVICAHLEVSHSEADFSFACPFCDDYKARTCSFVAEHIRTAHPENSGRCMERRLEKANLYVEREYPGTGPPAPAAPPRDKTPAAPTAPQPTRATEPAKNTASTNQENRSPDDEVMIVDVPTSQAPAPAARPPLQPLAVVHHGSETQQQQKAPQAPLPQPESVTVEVYPGFTVSRADYDRYQVFNLKPPRPPSSHVARNPPQNMNPPAGSRAQQIQNQIRNSSPQMRSAPLAQNAAPPRAQMRAPPPVRPAYQPRPQQAQSRPMPPLQPRPYMQQNTQQQQQQHNYQQQQQNLQQQQQNAMQQTYYSQMQAMPQQSPVPQMSPTAMSLSPGAAVPNSMTQGIPNTFPHLMQAMNPGMNSMNTNMNAMNSGMMPQMSQSMSTQMAQPMLYNAMNQQR